MQCGLELRARVNVRENRRDNPETWATLWNKTPNEEKQTKKTNTEKKQAEKHFPHQQTGDEPHV